MAPRPFPAPFRIGCDVAQLSRFSDILYKAHTNTRIGYMAFLRRLLTPRELVFFKAKFQSAGFLHPDVRAEIASDRKAKGLVALEQGSKRFIIDDWRSVYTKALTTRQGFDRLVRYLAGRWAAKEACIKAVKPRKIVALRSVEVWPDDSGEVFAIILSGSGVSPSQLGAGSGDGPERGNLPGDARLQEANVEAADNEAQAVPLKSGEGWQWLLQKDEKLSQDVPSHESIEGQIARLSISHEGDYAFAVAMADSMPAAGDVGGEAAARQASGA